MERKQRPCRDEAQERRPVSYFPFYSTFRNTELLPAFHLIPVGWVQYYERQKFSNCSQNTTVHTKFQKSCSPGTQAAPVIATPERHRAKLGTGAANGALGLWSTCRARSGSCHGWTRTGGHQDETVLAQQRRVDGLQLICPETVQTKLFVKRIHHFFRMGKLRSPEPFQRRVVHRLIWQTKQMHRQSVTASPCAVPLAMQNCFSTTGCSAPPQPFQSFKLKSWLTKKKKIAFI